MAEFLVDGGGTETDVDEIQELRAEFIEDLYPTLQELDEPSLELKFKDGSKDADD